MSTSNKELPDKGTHLRLIKNPSKASSGNPVKAVGGLKRLDRVPPSGWRLVNEEGNVPSREEEIERARELAESAPEIRSEKVQRLKAAIEEGRYHVDAETLAESLLRDSLLNQPE